MTGDYRCAINLEGMINWGVIDIASELVGVRFKYLPPPNFLSMQIKLVCAWEKSKSFQRWCFTKQERNTTSVQGDPNKNIW
jgi:hypothetical protein